MKIPETLQIAGIEYTVKIVNADHHNLDYGRCNGGQIQQISTIALNENLKGDMLSQTFMHEVTHAICDALSISGQDIYIDERFVDSFSHLLLQVIKQL